MRLAPMPCSQSSINIIIIMGCSRSHGQGNGDQNMSMVNQNPTTPSPVVGGSNFGCVHVRLYVQRASASFFRASDEDQLSYQEFMYKKKEFMYIPSYPIGYI